MTEGFSGEQQKRTWVAGTQRHSPHLKIDLIDYGQESKTEQSLGARKQALAMLPRSTPLAITFSNVNTCATTDSPVTTDMEFVLSDPKILLNGEPVPVFSAGLSWLPDKKTFIIESVRCHKDYRGAGIGKIVTRNIFDLAQSLGAEKINLLAGGIDGGRGPLYIDHGTNSNGPYYWLRCGAKLEPQSYAVKSDGGKKTDIYAGETEFFKGVTDRLKRMQSILSSSSKNPEALAKISALLPRLQEKDYTALWELADATEPVDYKGGLLGKKFEFHDFHAQFSLGHDALST